MDAIPAQGREVAAGSQSAGRQVIGSRFRLARVRIAALALTRSCEEALAELATAERNHAILWLPVCMGTGVLFYYSLRFEPQLWCGVAATVVAVAAALGLRGTALPFMLCMVLAAAAIGFTAGQFATARAPPAEAGLPTHAVRVVGVVRAVEALPDGQRVTLEQASLDGAPPRRRYMRIRLRRDDHAVPATGDTIRTRALIRLPSPPSLPGGWDRQRDAYYSGLGASGFALGPTEILAYATPAASTRVLEQLREHIAARVAALIPSSGGAFAVTLLTGFQNGMNAADHDAFRASGLAHLLAVAGLHIGIVMGLVMLAARTVLAASEHASLFWPTKQLSALAALAAGLGYAFLTGLHIPIQRSFIMATLFTLALLVGRRAISLRGLALAATVLMLVEPQEVPGVSFQMSFSAVLALIAGYAALRPWLNRMHGQSLGRRVGSHCLALALTSALAGTASAPYGAYHFGRIQLYFILANMAAVPLTAMWVMPAGLIALMLMPFKLDWLALVPMRWGAEAVVSVARATAALPAATVAVPHMPAWGLATLSIGIAWLGLWRTRLRLAGIVAIAVGAASIVMTRPPDLLISDDARLIAIRTAQGVWMQTTAGGSRFARDEWLQYWGRTDAPRPLPVEGTGDNGAIVCSPDECLLRPRPGAMAVLLLRRPVASARNCAGVGVIVSPEPARGSCQRPWPRLVDRFTVWRDGAAAVWLEAQTARVVTDRNERGRRPWVPPPPSRRSRPTPDLPTANADHR